jgi:hypothetical protein
VYGVFSDPVHRLAFGRKTVNQPFMPLWYLITSHRLVALSGNSSNERRFGRIDKVVHEVLLLRRMGRDFCMQVSGLLYPNVKA